MPALKEFEGLEAFALHLAARELALHTHLHKGLDKALVLLEKDMKAQIGHYQGEVGEFPAWAPLADSTEAEKKRLGAPLGAPLLRHGGMYASFQHESKDDEGVVGSTDPTMVFHEFGTSKMAPRPVVGPAMVRQQDKVRQILGRALVEGILGGEITAGGAAYFGGDL